jgi:hypothetical protein
MAFANDLQKYKNQHGNYLMFDFLAQTKSRINKKGRKINSSLLPSFSLAYFFLAV